MKIDIICNDGSPLGVTEKTMKGEDGRLGIGGAELALLTMCDAWKNYKHYDVTLYNNPKEPNASSFTQKNLDEFVGSDKRDILIIFRSPNDRMFGARGKKVWWSCDQFTIGDFKEWNKHVDKTVCISAFHKDYFNTMYGIIDAEVIDIPVRSWEYKEHVEKIPKRCIFTSVPDRGAKGLRKVWEKVCLKVPDASLVITSDWRLWSPYATEAEVQPYKLSFSRMPNVTYKGAVRRNELITLQQSAVLHVYPCTYNELFCIAVAESQVAGVFPITSSCGALPTTNMGLVLSGNAYDDVYLDMFAGKVIELLNDPNLPEKQKRVQELALDRFSIEKVCEQWDRKIFGING